MIPYLTMFERTPTKILKPISEKGGKKAAGIHTCLMSYTDATPTLQVLIPSQQRCAHRQVHLQLGQVSILIPTSMYLHIFGFQI